MTYFPKETMFNYISYSEQRNLCKINNRHANSNSLENKTKDIYPKTPGYNKIILQVK